MHGTNKPPPPPQNNQEGPLVYTRTVTEPTDYQLKGTRSRHPHLKNIYITIYDITHNTTDYKFVLPIIT